MRLSRRGATAWVAVALVALVPLTAESTAAAQPASLTSPTRFLDTRIGLGARPGKLGPGEVLQVAVPPAAAGASSVAINLTATEAEGPGWVKIWPCGEPEPAASSLNFTPEHVAQANSAMVEVGGGGSVCLSTYAPVHVVADLSAWFAGTDDFVGTSPTRILDTRIAGNPLQPNEERRVTVAGTAGVPTTAAVAALNITVDAPPSDGWVAAFPCGTSPSGSTVNFKAGETVATMTVVGLTAGQVCLRSWGVTPVVVDTYGWSTGGGGLRVQSPQRLLDTRQPASWPYGPFAADSTIVLPVAGRNGVPLDAEAALVTVTVDQTGGAGVVTVWPCDQPLPTTSTINTWADQLRSNLAVVRLAADGTACFHLYSTNGSSVALVVDAIGWTTAGPSRRAPALAPPPASGSGGGSCGLSNEAFCSSFDPAAGAALDPSVWSIGRVVGDNHNSQDELALFPSVPVPACRAGVSTATAAADVMVCDSASGRGGQLMTALGAQNYGLLSLAPRQPFDFAGRTGTIVYDVDAETSGNLGWWTSLFITDEPVPVASSATQVIGYLPRYGLGITFDANCGSTGKVGVGSLTVYRNSVESTIVNSNPTCVSAARGTLNHFRVQVSQSTVVIDASDAGGAALRTIFSGNVALSFTRGYVHFQSALRAPQKYQLSPGYAVNTWSRMGFDGPEMAAPIAAVVPNSLTPLGSGVNVGYRLAGGQPLTLTIAGVPGNRTSAVLALTAQFEFGTDPTLSYQLNGGPTHAAAADIAAQKVCQGCPGPDGGSGVGFAFPVDVRELRDGANTITFTSTGQNGSWAYVVANVQLLINGG